MIELDNQVTELLTDYCEGSISAENMDILKSWMEESNENRQLASRYLKLFRNYKAYSSYDKISKEEAFEKLILKVKRIKRRRTFLSIRNAAAIFILLIGSASAFFWLNNKYENFEAFKVTEVVKPGVSKATLILADGSQIKLKEYRDSTIREKSGALILKKKAILDYQQSNVKKVIYNTIRIPRGGEYSLILSDGTKVWLNSDSELTYPICFLKGQRKVQLRGEAYFEVAKDITKPFIVSGKQASVKVLGTSFNVKSYDNDNRMETTLVEGSVQLINQSKKNKNIILCAGEQGVLIQGNTDFQVKMVDTKLYTSWKDGLFIFDNMNLEEIMKILSRWYDVEIEFENQELKNLHFSGNVKRYDVINTHLEMISLTTNVDFNIQNHIVRVTKKKE